MEARFKVRALHLIAPLPFWTGEKLEKKLGLTSRGSFDCFILKQGQIGLERSVS